MKSIFIFFIKGYQFTFGRLFPRVCRFAPSCSSYAIEAIQMHGIFRGGLLSMWRILRCNPFFSGGLDPVPPRNSAVRDSFQYNTCGKEGRNE